MPGRPDFSIPGSQGSGQTIAVNQRPEVATHDERPSTSVASGDSEVISIYAPTGATYRVLSTVLTAPAVGGATSGKHSILVKMPGPSVALRMQSNYNESVDWHSAYRSATVVKEPATDGAAHTSLQTVMGTENTAITIWYNNNTDAAQSGTRRYSLAFEEASY